MGEIRKCTQENKQLIEYDRGIIKSFQLTGILDQLLHF